MKRIFAAFSLLSLVACGGVTTSASPTLKPTVAQNYSTGSGGSLSGTVLSSDPSGLISSIKHGGTSFTGISKITGGSSTFGMAQDPSADGLAFDVVAFSDDGKAFQGATSIVSATMIASSTSSAAGFGQLATFRRDSNSVLPTSSVGVYTGDYRGTIGADGVSYTGGYDSGAVVSIKGTVTLTANFNNQTISGGITSRRILLVDRVSGASLGNVTLSSTSIDGNGMFDSSATVSATISGDYYGLIGGANGTAIAGALMLDHNGVFTEVGVFTGTRN